jgi:phospholipid-translocating ATPase
VTDPNVTLPRIRLSDGVITHFVDSQISADIKNADGKGHAQAKMLDDFFTCLGLCHSVLASIDSEGAVSYKAQSPDEAALVQAAADTGYIFVGREPGSQIIRLQTPRDAEPKRYELLNLLDFTSARKRMSVILRILGDHDGHDGILLLCKGADNVIFERLEPGTGDTFKEKTSEDLDRFAGEGLRTLCLAHRYLSGEFPSSYFTLDTQNFLQLRLPEEEYSAWNIDYRNAQVQLEDRDEHIESVSSRIEQHLSLLGATAIEDKLQDGVPETIADLKRAGIKVWVATGDKLETAIGAPFRACCLLRLLISPCDLSYWIQHKLDLSSVEPDCRQRLGKQNSI